jgi:hypothetical protein
MRDEWEDAYFKEYKGIMDRKAVKVVKQLTQASPWHQGAWNNHSVGIQDGQRRVHQAEGTHVRPW